MAERREPGGLGQLQGSKNSSPPQPYLSANLGQHRLLLPQQLQKPLCVPCECRCPRRPEDDVRSLELELHAVGVSAGN